MKNQRLSIAAVLCLFALPVAANANALAFGGSGGAIPDNVASGVNFNAIVAPGAGFWQAATTTVTGVVAAGTYAAARNALTGNLATAYVPTNLNIFAGENSAGTWRLNISDNAGGDTGRLGAWQVNGVSSAGSATPEPASLALLFAALPSVAVLRRRKR